MASSSDRAILSQFQLENGNLLGGPVEIPLTVNIRQLNSVANGLVQAQEKLANDTNEPIPYSFFIDEIEIKESLEKYFQDQTNKQMFEKTLNIICVPKARFQVIPVERCTATIEGHLEAITILQFSPNGKLLASGSGDTTVRFWDLNTQTPFDEYGKAHRHWILCLSWAPNGKIVASSCKQGLIGLWVGATGKQHGTKLLSGHRQWINSLSWQPLHLDGSCRLLASGSKDTTIKIWDTHLFKTVFTLCGHTASVTCIKWGGQNLLYSASQDRTIKVWRTTDGILCRTLEGHAHWVNTLALSTDYVLRTGFYDPSKERATDDYDNLDEITVQTLALERYEKVYKLFDTTGGERLVSGSDDFTLYLWKPETDKKPLARMTGHQQLINDVKFSPDTRILASASFDKSIKLWSSRTGTFLTTLRGHVQAVYQIAWSADSRLLVSGSADSTLKVWNIEKRCLLFDLPGHADEIYAVDYSPDGQKVASGGKDKVLKLWRR
ncbi:unnamed protein product [Adineta steineri]|uniref:NLE domain-containing protein n=1 Tax=Adineta steineri TaxID=433720 RepID=A0A818YAT1_9BILA|nr:unnamed protein product [Adineta steineri]CAF3751357.1 unnamed protein product [Adineta steineri]